MLKQDTSFYLVLLYDYFLQSQTKFVILYSATHWNGMGGGWGVFPSKKRGVLYRMV